jgi:hypothetical protein
MVDFIGAEYIARVGTMLMKFETASPFVKDVKAKGVDTFIDCTTLIWVVM